MDTSAHRLLVGVALVIIAIYIGSWVVTQHLTGYNIGKLINHRYAGTPWPTMVLNLSVGLDCSYICGLCALVYRTIYRSATQQEERQGALIGLGTYLLVASYGGVIVVQTLLDRLGIGTWSLPGLTVTLALVIGIICSVSVMTFTLTPFGWSAVRGHLSPTEQEMRCSSGGSRTLSR